VEAILLTHAEVAVAVAGFASVVAAFQRPLAPVQRNRFLAILLSSLVQILACLVPIWLSESQAAGPDLWRLSSLLFLGAIVVAGITMVYPLKNLGMTGIVVMNLPVTILLWFLTAVSVGALIANVLVVSAPGFRLYYATLLAGLCVVFLTFADVATRDD